MTLRGQFLFWNGPLFAHENLSDLAKAFWFGIPFDLVAITWTLVPVVLWGWFIRGLTWIPFFLFQIPLWAISVIDIEMWNFWGRRMTFSSLEILKEGQGKATGIAADYGIWIFLSILVGILFGWFAVRIFKKEAKPPFKWNSKRIILEQIIILILLILGTRGGFQKKPLNLVNADHFKKAQMNQLTLNTNFTLLKSFKKTSLTREKHFAEKSEALKRVNGRLASQAYLPNLNFGQKQNIVILILESFSWEYTGLNLQSKKSYTPFLDTLMKKSLTFPRAFASGRRSIEGIAAILSGIPALMEEPFITSEFSTNEFVGVGHVLTRNGYDTSFYHGGGNGTMHFDAFTAKAGIQNYFGSHEYPNPEDNDGVWGIYDRPYLKYFSSELSKKKEPFFSTLFTLSSHQPYKIPKYEVFENFETPHPILKAVAYTDSSLEDFFKLAERQSWYQNTLFVLVGDHTGPQVMTDFEDQVSAYRIPLVFFHPQISNWPAEIDRNQLAQQIDIPASLYDFLRLKDSETVALSRSVFRPGQKNFTAFIPGTYLHTDGKTVLIERAQKKTFIDFENFNQIRPENPELEISLKAVKQVFSEGLWDNALYF